jgi:protein phosphatase
MAEWDIFGILAFLLAVGGAAYLVRSRFFNRDDPAAASVRSEPAARPASVTNDLDGRTSAAEEPESDGTPEASLGRSSASRRAAEPAAAEDGPHERREDAEGTAAAKADGDVTCEAASEKSATGDASEKSPEPAIDAGTVLAAVAPTNEDGSTKVEAMKDTLLSAGTVSKRAEESTCEPPPAPQGSVPSRSDGPLAQTSVGDIGLSRPEPPPPKGSTPPVDARDEAPAADASKSTTEPATLKTPDLDDEVPRLDYEEDEELEPTRFGGKREIQPAVEKIVVDEGADAEPSAEEATARLALQALGKTDPGKRRKHNEDALLVLEDKGLFIVADGMGGHRGGQLASKLAVKTLADAFEANRFAAAAHADIPAPASELARAIQMANTAILQHAAKQTELKGMGTTICAMRFSEDKRRLYIGHVGDSRCYRIRDGVMKQLTTDHTMSDYGIAGPEGAHLSRALGVWPTVPIDIIMAAPQAGDLYLLCSDGLTKMLPNETISTQLLHEEDAQTAINRLVFFANAHGGKDNITIVLIRVVEAESSSS